MTIPEMLALRDRNHHQFETTPIDSREAWDQRIKELRGQHPPINGEALVRARAEVDTAIKAGENAVKYGAISALGGAGSAGEIGPIDSGDSGSHLSTDLDN